MDSNNTARERILTLTIMFVTGAMSHERPTCTMASTFSSGTYAGCAARACLNDVTCSWLDSRNCFVKMLNTTQHGTTR